MFAPMAEASDDKLPGIVTLESETVGIVPSDYGMDRCSLSTENTESAHRESDVSNSSRVTHRMDSFKSISESKRQSRLETYMSGGKQYTDFLKRARTMRFREEQFGRRPQRVNGGECSTSEEARHDTVSTLPATSDTSLCDIDPDAHAEHVRQPLHTIDARNVSVMTLRNRVISRMSVLSTRSSPGLSSNFKIGQASAKDVRTSNWRPIVESTWFSTVAIFVVVLHSIFLMVETDFADQIGSGPGSTGFAVDLVFTVFYVVEMLTRFVAYGTSMIIQVVPCATSPQDTDDGEGICDGGVEDEELPIEGQQHKNQYFIDWWNIIDVLLVILSLADIIVAATTTTNDPSLSVMICFRMIRLVRLVRLMRLFHLVKPLWLLTCGIITSMRTVLWAWVLIGLVIYIVGLSFARIFAPYSCGGAKADPEIHEYWGSVPRSMFTVFQVITLEDWITVADVSIRHEPWVRILFLLLLGTCTYGLMQVIVAVFVNSALEASTMRSQDLAKRAKGEREETCRKLCEVFRKADVDGDGTLTKEEFVQVLKIADVVERLKAVGIDGSSAAALFDVLDIDGSKTLDGTEFVEGVLRSRGTAQNKDMIGMRCDVWRVSISLEEEIERASGYIQDRVKETVSRVEALRKEAQPLMEHAAMVLRQKTAVSAGHPSSSSSTNQQNNVRSASMTDKDALPASFQSQNRAPSPSTLNPAGEVAPMVLHTRLDGSGRWGSSSSRRRPMLNGKDSTDPELTSDP